MLRLLIPRSRAFGELHIINPQIREGGSLPKANGSFGRSSLKLSVSPVFYSICIISLAFFLFSSDSDSSMRTKAASRLLSVRSQFVKSSLFVRNMATATQIHLSTTNTGVYHVPNIKKSSAERASQVLQENHDRNHIHFNDDGFHSMPYTHMCNGRQLTELCC